MTALLRWRLVLGEAGDRDLGGLDGADAERDCALGWLYDRDPELAERGIAGRGSAGLTTPDWLDRVHRLFPRTTIDRIERDAVERFNLSDVLTHADVLARATPSPTLLRAILRTRHLMAPDVLAAAHLIVRQVVAELVERLARPTRSAFGRSRRRPSHVPRARDLNLPRSIRASLGHRDAATGRLLLAHRRFVTRDRRALRPWQIILLVDQSGSMAGNLIHAAVVAACLWSVPGLHPHLLCFDDRVVDHTPFVSDPAELLMRVQLGGGTDIGRAVAAGLDLVRDPRNAILVLITDLGEGAPPGILIERVRRAVAEGVTVLALGALDLDAQPAWDREIAARLAAAGAHVAALTPDALVPWLADRVRA